jgi:hypothetical protein
VSAALAVVVVVVAACNQTWGLDATKTVDARPSGCRTSLAFESSPHTVTRQEVRYYQFDAARSLAIALSSSIVEGKVDAPELVPAVLEPEPSMTIASVRLAADGDQLFVQLNTGTTSTLERYDRDGDRWKDAGPVAIAMKQLDQISAPTRRPQRRMLHYTGTGIPTSLLELAEDEAGAWSMVGQPYLMSSFGVSAVLDPNLTADGLGIVFRGVGVSGENGLYYAQRASFDERFGTSTRVSSLIGNGTSQFPHLEPDCSRLYFYAQPGVHYVTQ